MGLKEAQLADPFGRDPASGEIRHASRFEGKTNVGNIYLVGEDGQSNGSNLRYRRIRKGQHNVEVVNHQVEDHIHIQARGENALSR